MLKTAFEAATLIGVVVAVIAGVFYAMGTLALSSYYTALGFDAHQFPTFGLEPQLVGFASIVIPAVCIIGALVVWGVINKLIDAWVASPWMVQRFEQQKRPEPQKKRWPDVERFLSPLLRPISAAGILLVVCLIMIAEVSRQSAATANQKAKDWQKSKPSTTIEFTDGHKICAPGVRVVCSERFCGFHDGNMATVISLEGVRSIQSPMPQEQPSPPTAESRGFWRRLFGE